jgi:hypothetical protein
VEVEYERAMRKAELSWIKSLIEDLQSGRLNWDREALRRNFNQSEAKKNLQLK